MPVLRDVGEAGSQRCRRGREANALAVEQHLAGIGPIDSEQDASDLGTTRADQAGEADDLARPNGERDVAEGAGSSQVADLE